MTTQEQIDSHIAGQPPTKREELLDLHRRVLGVAPDCKLWFLDGRDDTGKVVTNPNIGYGAYEIRYANGETKEFYRVGLSANTTGISVYVMGLADKKHLPDTYGERIGKAKVTGYCIKFKSTKDIDLDVLEEIIAERMG
jgi:hypothetical protein